MKFVFFYLMVLKSIDGQRSIVGQLGHGDQAAYKSPRKVEAFEGLHVEQATCGADFTLCITGKLFRIILY